MHVKHKGEWFRVVIDQEFALVESNPPSSHKLVPTTVFRALVSRWNGKENDLGPFDSSEEALQAAADYLSGFKG